MQLQHPGNILVRLEEPLKGSSLAALGNWLRIDLKLPRLVLLDVGMIARLSSEDQHNLVGFFKVMHSKHALADWEGQGELAWGSAFAEHKLTAASSVPPAILASHLLLSKASYLLSSLACACAVYGRRLY